MIFSNGRLILAGEIRDGLELVVNDGKIAQIRAATKTKSREIIDLGGNYLAPGFIDLHLHGAKGRDTMEGTPEAFREICAFHASGGTTALLLTTATAPIGEITRVLRSVKDNLAGFLQVLGVHVEGPFISRAKPGAQRPEFISDATPDKVAQILAFADIIKIVTLAPEIPGALDAIKQMVAQGIRVSGGHSDAMEDQARRAFEHGMTQVTHTFNCMSSSRRQGIHRVAGLLEFALSEPAIICEVIADGFHVSPTLMRMLYRAKDSQGVCLVTDATAGAGLPEGSRFALAGVECVVKDGVCLLADESALAGSAARMIDLVRTMVRAVGLPLPEVIGMATANPARALGIENRKGVLAPGADADLVVLSEDLQVRQTFLGGEQIYDS